MPQRNAYFVEMRKYDNPASPSTSAYDVELPVTSGDAVIMPSGESATDAINTVKTAANNAVAAASTAQTIANAAMPKVGGYFNGLAYAVNQDVQTSCLRNIQVVTTGWASSPATSYILMER